MVLFSRLLQILVTFYCVTQSSPSNQLSISYTVSLVKQLAAEQSGIFHIWIYYFANGYHNEILRKVYDLLQNEPITRTVIDTNFDWSSSDPSIRYPSFVIICMETVQGGEPTLGKYGYLLSALRSETRIMFLLRNIEWDWYGSRLLRLQSMIKQWNVIYLLSDSGELLYNGPTCRKFAKLQQHFPLKEAFIGRVRELHGHEIRFNTAKKSFANACDPPKYCYGYEVNLVFEIAKHLNGTPRHVTLDCPGLSQGLHDCVSQMAFTLNATYDIFTEPTLSDMYIDFYINVAFPSDDAFLVPAGRPMTIVELFLHPFDADLWITLFCALTLLKVTSLILFKKFKNDIIFLPICGFERFGVHKAGSREKIVLVCLIIFFAFLSNSYETRITSMMASRPLVEGINTLQELTDSGLGVKTGESQQFASYSLNLNYIYKKPTDPNEDRLDGTNAYQMNSALASWLLQRIDNWDLKTDQPRYKILRETFGMNTAFYIVPMRSVLQPTFHHIQRTLFEAGVLGLWRQQLAQNMTGGALKRGRVAAGAGVNPDAEILMFADVVPAWVILGFGSAVSLGVYLVECLVHYFGKGAWHMRVVKVLHQTNVSKYRIGPTKQSTLC